jgi:hypothetical protein
MSDLQKAAGDLWTRLIIAMREDGIIAQCITQSGPATTALILSLVQPGATPDHPWLPVSIKPEPQRAVLGCTVNGLLLGVYWDGSVWRDTLVGDEVLDIAQWRFMDLPVPTLPEV